MSYTEQHPDDEDDNEMPPPEEKNFEWDDEEDVNHLSSEPHDGWDEYDPGK